MWASIIINITVWFKQLSGVGAEGGGGGTGGLGALSMT